jgi:DNA-binding CsgD family transcriptional regulator
MSMADRFATMSGPGIRAAGVSTSIALLVVDDQRRCLEVNLAACRLFGLSREGVLGHTLDDLLADDMGERLENVWRAFRETGGHAGPFTVSVPEARVERVDISVTSGVLPGRHLLIVLPAGEHGSNGGSNGHADGVRSPTNRELEVLEQLAGGATDGQIATRLELSPATVQTHVRNAKAKLGARTRAQAVAIALRRGMISLS